ncbi:MAG: TonB-dependent receptor [Acidobacteriaceae bacterium]
MAFAMLLGVAMVLQISQPTAFAQSLTSGAIGGTVADPTGAAIPDAQVVIKNLGTGATFNTTTNAAGSYRESLLSPGKYSVTVTSAGFNTATETVTVSLGAISPGSIKMAIGKSSQTVTVSESEPLLNTENADITTTFSQNQIQNLPNPGNDLTFVAQTAPGVVMNTTTPSNNTAFGYGNFSSFGLPATSNTFTINGGYENDPFLNLNNSGATNLLLGNNDIAQVTVVNNAYGAQYGGLGGAQVNEITRSGTNEFHGNANYWWNGRVMNANNYFNKQQQVYAQQQAKLNNLPIPKQIPPFDNVNQWAAGVGGPIWKDKTFFWVDSEGTRIVIPVSAVVYAPSPAFIAATLANAKGTGNTAYLTQLFNIYTSAKGYAPTQVTADPNVINYNTTASNFTHEQLLAGRIDQHINDKDNLFGHFEYDNGVQATYTDLINPIFNADSPQPQWSGQLNETHVFNPNITNSFTFALLWYQAVFTDTQLAAANKLVPYTLNWTDLGSQITSLGGLDFVWPQGRKVTNYQFIDDLSVIKGNHNFKMGYYFRRDDVTDLSPSVLTTPLALASENDFQAGSLDLYAQQFPTRLTQPVALYNEAGYFQDEWKALPNLVVTAALRLEHNSNPVCQTNCFDTFKGSAFNQNTSPTAAYNSIIHSGLHTAFQSFQKIGWEPRVGFSWSPMGVGTKTVVRGGFGIFNDVFPGTIADSVLNNAPTNVGFTLFGPFFGSTKNPLPPINPNPAQPGYPTQPASGETITAASNKAFQAGFADGTGNVTSLSASVPGFAPPNFTNPAPTIQYPVYYEWNMEIERQLNSNTVIDLNYVGNRGYHEPVVNNQVNSYNGTGLPFAGMPTTQLNPSFTSITQVGSNAESNYNGLTASIIHHSKSLVLQANYEYSHALDEISNGGILGFGALTSSLNQQSPTNLSYNYGNADYDLRQNFTASYVYTLPYWRGPHILTDGWQASGTVFHQSGFPFTVIDSAVAFSNYGGSPYAKQLHGVSTCGGSHVLNLATGTGPACGIANPANYTTPTAFGQQERNQVRSPGYTDTDFAVMKGFAIPHWNSAKVQLGAQFFNLLNHPNFAAPVNDINNPNVGLIDTTINTPTSILGAGLGGNASPRLIQLKGVFVF